MAHLLRSTALVNNFQKGFLEPILISDLGPISNKKRESDYNGLHKISDRRILPQHFNPAALLSHWIIINVSVSLIPHTWVTSLDQAFSNIPLYKNSNNNSCWHCIGSISVSANTPSRGIGIGTGRTCIATPLAFKIHRK